MNGASSSRQPNFAAMTWTRFFSLIRPFGGLLRGVSSKMVQRSGLDGSENSHEALVEPASSAHCLAKDVLNSGLADGVTNQSKGIRAFEVAELLKSKFSWQSLSDALGTVHRPEPMSASGCSRQCLTKTSQVIDDNVMIAGIFCEAILGRLIRRGQEVLRPRDLSRLSKFLYLSNWLANWKY